MLKEFMEEVQTIAYDISKSNLIDAEILKYRPSFLAACQIYLGFQLYFEKR